MANRSELAGWGNLKVPGQELRSEELRSSVCRAPLTRGLGRSYGDSSLPPPGALTVAGSALADRILSFDPETGIVRTEAGFTLDDLNRVFLRRGWFTPVSPGTKFVTVGGMVASDVHGKNHHRQGTFGAHVRALRMCLADGQVLECSRTQHDDLFRATVGGMGLTGHILEVEFTLERIPSPWIVMESRRIDTIDDFVGALNDAGPKWPFTMGWVDCVSRGKAMGRGILMTGRWAEPDEAPHRPPPDLKKLLVPFMLPNWALNRLTVRAFNALYYRRHLRRQRRHIIHPDKFFYPLDAIHGWNHVYGRRGFTQHQCVLPKTAGLDVVRQFLDLLTRLGGASPLCVIKDCGEEGEGMLSFPKPGISIAVDLAITSGTQSLIDALNEFVIEHRGRIYLTKDTFTRAEHYQAMDPRLAEWQAVRRRWDPQGRLRSRQSVRLLGDA